ncbi:MAG: ImmA/IrrE family metallo-endopeptidase [Candidatus Cloacimonas sp.]|jgi:Zn-dependent peptidase ImmA (M78 family)|nr:ImmA/IrrE family metallo-endopeptidase [Candidatus Cloacimonas sp.]
MRVEVKPEMLRWACDRAGYSIGELAHRIPKLPTWESLGAKPTLNQVEKFAKTVHVPIGYLFLQQPPVEQVPIPDFRTIGSRYIGHPSPDLLDTIYICQQRQEWYREYAQATGEDPCAFVGAVNVANNVTATAARIRQTLGFDIAARRNMGTWEEALRKFIEQVDDAGVLVMVNGVVGNNNHRKLDPDEFRGFALSDNLAPLIFLNGADTKSAQMFSLAHELAHIWLGQSALSDVEPITFPTLQIETWCNQVAAEFLVPLADLQGAYQARNDLTEEIDRLARYFKVSTLVILRRIFDAGHLTQKDLWDAYRAEVDRLLAIRRAGGGNFYSTQAARVSKRFARALVSSTLEGKTLYREAFHLLGFSKHETFRELGHSLGIE